MHVSVVKHDLLPLTPHSPTPTPPHTQTSAIGPRDSWGKCSLGKYSLGSRLTSRCIWWVLFVSRDCKFACLCVSRDSVFAFYPMLPFLVCLSLSDQLPYLLTPRRAPAGKLRSRNVLLCVKQSDGWSPELLQEGQTAKMATVI